MRVWGSALVCVLVAVLSLGVASASAGWHYEFQHFIETSKAATSSAITEVRRCARGLAGDWKLRTQMEVDVVSSSAPKHQSVEIEVTAKMPITTQFKAVRDVDSRWEAKLPSDPGSAALLSEHYDRLAKSQADFYEGMKVRWRPAKQKLQIEHEGLFYDGYPQLAPGGFVATFKPRPGC